MKDVARARWHPPEEDGGDLTDKDFDDIELQLNPRRRLTGEVGGGGEFQVNSLSG